MYECEASCTKDANVVPEQVNSRVGNKINLIKAVEMILEVCAVEEQSLPVKTEPFEVAMDLSLHRPIKRVNPMQSLVPPKKRLFVAQTASCSNNHHITIPAPPRRPS